jgi:hypothetical protein
MREGMEEFDRITFNESSNSGLNWLDADQQKIVKETLEYVGKDSLLNVEPYSQNEVDTKFYLNDGKGDLTIKSIILLQKKGNRWCDSYYSKVVDRGT